MRFLVQFFVVSGIGLMSCGCPAVAGAELPAAELVISPQGIGVDLSVSPSGGHVALVVKKGPHFAAVIDGVEGPAFEEIPGLHLGNGATVRTEAGGPSLMTPVVFSADGNHSIYAGRNGTRWSIMYDGKEVGQEQAQRFSGLAWIRLSPTGGGIALAAPDANGMQHRIYVNGQPGPLGVYPPTHFVFNQDGTHFAYTGSQFLNQQVVWMVIDGRQVEYAGEVVQILSGGRVLTQSNLGGAPVVFLNGKPVYRPVTLAGLAAVPDGEHFLAMGQPAPGRPVEFVVDGNPVPMTAAVNLSSVLFSPDGHHWAIPGAKVVAGKNPLICLIVDGKTESDFQQAGPAGGAGFSPDSTKFAYSALQPSGEWALVVNGQITGTGLHTRPGISSFQPLVWSEEGAHLAWAMMVSGKTAFIKDGVLTPMPASPAAGPHFVFSPRGDHIAWEGGNALAIDDATVPNLRPVYFDGALAYDGLGRFIRFSRDGKHYVCAGLDTRQPSRHGVWLDGKLVCQSEGPQFNRVTFTPDGRHVAWAAADYDDDGKLNYRAYLDGRPVVRFAGSVLDGLAGTWELAADGTLTVIGLEGAALKRWRIKPIVDASVDTIQPVAL